MTCEYRVLENVALADAAFEANGDSPSELFLAATNALMNTLADSSTVLPVWKRVIEKQSQDLSVLLFDWLNELVYLKDAEGVVFHAVETRVDSRPHDGWHLRATLTGSPIDAATQVLHSDVKAVTKHLYDVRQEGSRWFATVVLDI